MRFAALLEFLTKIMAKLPGSNADRQPELRPIDPDSAVLHDRLHPAPTELLCEVDITSDTPLPPLPERDQRATEPAGMAAQPHAAARLDAKNLAAGTEPVSFWLEGDVLLCACPDCGAPMTVRLWLLVADCWRCGISIELTAQQRREVERLLQRGAVRTDPSDVRASETASVPAARPHRPPPANAGLPTSAPPAPPAQPPPKHRPTARLPGAAATARPAAADPHSSGQLPARSAGSLFQDMPAWLVSLLFHVILLILLGLLTYEDKPELPFITLSTRVSRVVREGGDTTHIEPTDVSVFDLGVPQGVNMDDPAERRALVRADQDARRLRLVDPTNPHLPDLARAKQLLSSSDVIHHPLLARDPRLRIEVVKREGGTTLTEAAVARGLLWLARHQSKDGSWSVDRFEQVASCRCGGQGSLRSDVTGTSLALLPFLGAGQTHLTGIYKDVVAAGLRWLVQHQGKDGDLRGSQAQYPGMYTQGQAAIVLCEAFLMTGDESLRAPAQNAIDFIVQAQYPDGGWRYYPKSRGGRMQGDTSVFGWQLMALQSAYAANLRVPEETLENADHFLDSVQRDQGALYAYMRGEDATPPMTAEGLLCRIYLGWKHDNPALDEGVSWMLDQHPPAADKPNIYYWYYGTQTMHHYGGDAWEQWNLKMRDVLINIQEKRGHQAGSWAPRGPLSSQGGRIYVTSLSICCLEVYYRHLPLFRQLNL